MMSATAHGSGPCTKQHQSSPLQAQYLPGMPQAFGQHPVSFGSITPSMAAAPAYFQPVPVAPFVPGPAHHTLHANAHEFVRPLSHCCSMHCYSHIMWSCSEHTHNSSRTGSAAAAHGSSRSLDEALGSDRCHHKATPTPLEAPKVHPERLQHQAWACLGCQMSTRQYLMPHMHKHLGSKPRGRMSRRLEPPDFRYDTWHRVSCVYHLRFLSCT